MEWQRDFEPCSAGQFGQKKLRSLQRQESWGYPNSWMIYIMKMHFDRGKSLLQPTNTMAATQVCMYVRTYAYIYIIHNQITLLYYTTHIHTYIVSQIFKCSHQYWDICFVYWVALYVLVTSFNILKTSEDHLCCWRDMRYSMNDKDQIFDNTLW